MRCKMSAVSHREIAAACGCSTATVSRALAGSPLVGLALRRRVGASAKKLGYQRNALVGALMSQVRRERTQSFSGNLALINVRTAGEIGPRPFHRDVMRGAADRARELGFHLDVFEFWQETGKAAALHRILRARGIVGLIFLHSRETVEMRNFPWSAYVCVQIDYCLSDPILHTVQLDHHLTLGHALGRLHSLGYRRVGLFIEHFAKDAPLKFKWRGAFRAFQEGRDEIGHLPVFGARSIDEAGFVAWVRRHEPDLVVGHIDKAVGWLKAARRRVPKDVGFFNLNWNERTVPCAGLDLCPAEQGAVAAEVLIAQIQRNERSLPELARTTMVNGRWVDGPTVRLRPPAA